MDRSGANRGRGRPSCHAGARRKGRVRGQARRSLQRQGSPGQAGRVAQPGGGCSRGHCRSRTDGSESLGAECGRRRCGEADPERPLRAASRWRRQPQRLSQRGGRRSRSLPSRIPQLSVRNKTALGRKAADRGRIGGSGESAASNATAGAGSRAKLSSPSRMMSISWTSMLLPVAGMLELPRYMSEAKGGSRRPSQSDSECGAQTLGPVGICEMPCSIWPESLSFTSRAMSACATIPTSLLSSSTTGILRTW